MGSRVGFGVGKLVVGLLVGKVGTGGRRQGKE